MAISNNKSEQVVEKMTPYNNWVEANEPGTLQYEIFRQVNGDAETLIVLEVYVQYFISRPSSFLVNSPVLVDDVCCS
jgi:hypothetical protein